MLLNCGVEKTLESSLECKAIKTVNRKGNQPWVFTGRTDAKADISILWPPDAKNWLIGKDLDAGKDWLNTGGEGDDRGWDVWMASPIQWKWAWASSRSWVMDREAWCAEFHGVTKSWIWLSDWTELNAQNFHLSHIDS